MSLINKMLQDLDARGSSPGQGASPEPIGMRASPLRGRELPLRAAAIVACFLVLLILAAVLGWRHFAPAPKLKPLAPMPAPAIAPVSAAAPAPKSAPASAPMPAPVSAPMSAPMSAPIAAPMSAPIAAAAPPPVAVAPPAPAAPVATAVAAMAPAPARVRHASAQAAPPVRREALKAASTEAAPAPHAGASATPAPPPRAENEYRRALDALQEGRLGEALAGLQQTLLIDARHQAARETLVRLLLESNRLDEAMRALEQGLALDPKQPTQAMLLARLQLEKGGPAIDTLLLTLPYASDNGDYQAFLAGVLQRAQRNRESAEHYQLALRKAPQNGVWWMGLGIALQADRRVPEAREAYEHARAASLSPELQTFVERKLAQLSQMSQLSPMSEPGQPAR